MSDCVANFGTPPVPSLIETVIDAVLDAGIYARSFKDQSIEYGMALLQLLEYSMN